MPRYMLDTNMCIYLMKNQPEEVARRFAQCYVGDVAMSSITYAELEYGVAMAANPEQERINLASLAEDIQVIPFDAAAGVAYGPIRQATRDTKKDALDKLIAAHAVSLNAIVVTNNEKDFAKYPGVIMENWLIPTVYSTIGAKYGCQPEVLQRAIEMASLSLDNFLLACRGELIPSAKADVVAVMLEKCLLVPEDQWRSCIIEYLLTTSGISKQGDH